jgi:hypothetical protein
MLTKNLENIVIVPSNPIASIGSFAFFIKGVLFFMACKLAQKSINTTAHQHSIDSIIGQLTKGKGHPYDCREIKNWPSSQQYLGYQAYSLLNWLNPINNPSTLTLTKAEEIHEQRIIEMPGYQA